jgi:dihydrofolate reductase
MSRLRVHNFSISLDGDGAGPNQDLANPLGIGGMALHKWAFATRTFRRMFGQDGGTTGTDDEFAARSFKNIGAWILGRNMFGPIRGSWPDENWKGWWGDNPPYHTPVFVLTNHPRASIDMTGGTTSTLLPMAFTPHWNERWTLRTVRMSNLAAASLPSGNTCAPD